MSRTKTMSAAELRAGLFHLRLTQKDLAEITDYSKEQINAMCRERTPVRHPVSVLVKLMLEVPGVREKLFPWKPISDQQSIHAEHADA
jgi:hypothetical protein